MDLCLEIIGLSTPVVNVRQSNVVRKKAVQDWPL